MATEAPTDEGHRDVVRIDTAGHDDESAPGQDAAAAAAGSGAAAVAALSPKGKKTDDLFHLSPFDLANMNRAVPMTWFYSDTLDPKALVAALKRTLKHYPVLCGRYVPRKAGKPNTVKLCNAGVPVHTCTAAATTTLADAISHLSPKDDGDEGGMRSFPIKHHETFVPEKAGMDPDVGNPDAPLLKVKITTFTSAGGGGTAIGLLAQHGVLDAEAMVVFMRHWSQQFAGPAALDPPVRHDRNVVTRLGSSAETAEAEAEKMEKPANLAVESVAKPGPPAFMPVAKLIMGPTACVVPLRKAVLARFKASASVGLPDGRWVSTDDVVTARVWRALATVRCAQLGLDKATSQDVSRCGRAWNFRKRTEPPLGPGYVANGVSGCSTELPVCELLALSVGAIALKLRESLEKQPGATTVGPWARWLAKEQAQGNRIVAKMDAKALTFIISSWIFDWEAATFAGHAPVCFDHGAIVPIVSVFTPRPGGDGINVYASGTAAAVKEFAEVLLAE